MLLSNKRARIKDYQLAIAELLKETRVADKLTALRKDLRKVTLAHLEEELQISKVMQSDLREWLVMSDRVFFYRKGYARYEINIGEEIPLKRGQICLIRLDDLPEKVCARFVHKIREIQELELEEQAVMSQLFIAMHGSCDRVREIWEEFPQLATDYMRSQGNLRPISQQSVEMIKAKRSLEALKARCADT